ncbi:MAG TPA: mechanosensitive ion channel family protein [Candidatus Lokiarchaeia archaeon]|nr:mechanosensitive ion channel family protein [Candidatus Lokiarchaeia archaeon]
MLQTSIFDILAPYLVSLVIIVSTVIVAWLVNTMIKHYLHKREGAKKSKIVDIILKNLHPLYILIIVVGAYYAFMVLPFVAGAVFPNFNAWVETIFFIVLVFLICYVGARIVKIFVDRYFIGHREDTKTPGIIMNIIAPVIFILGFFIILGTYNVDILPLLTTFGIGGIAVGFALQPTLTNLFAGLIVISDHPIHVGDYVEVRTGDAGILAGIVHDIGWLSTHIRTFDNVTMIIPNSKLTTSVIFNYSSVDPKYVMISIAVNQNQELEKIEMLVKKVAVDVLSVMPGGSTARSPDVRFESMDATSVTVKVWLYLETMEAQFNTRSEFIKAIKKKFEEEGISFPKVS